jgi:hypothetical protein
MVDGDEYEGVITSHHFLDEKRVLIKEITLVGDEEVAKIKCEEIARVIKIKPFLYPIDG